MIIDAHAHVFPNKIARRASDGISDFYHMRTRYDGSVGTLLELGNQAGIDHFLIQSVATAPHQAEAINTFIAQTVREDPDHFTGFATLHPDMPHPEDEFQRAREMGLKGVKLHPDFQRFAINDKKVFAIYDLCQDVCPILMHTGDSRFDFSSPRFVPEVMENFPHLQMICAHFGGWSQWDEAAAYLLPTDVYIDTSSTLYTIPERQAKRLIDLFGAERVLFGSDYPMWNPGVEKARMDALELTDSQRERIYSGTFLSLLGK